MESHLLQMRGLKQTATVVKKIGRGSHLLQMRGLKRCLSAIRRWADCRIFYRCVD